MKAVPIVAMLMLAACVSTSRQPPADGFVRVNPASIAADPASFDGRQVEVVGLVVWEAENLGIYQSYGAYCRRGEQAAIHVDWRSWPGVTEAHNRRRAIIRGTFRNRIGVTQPDGSVVVSTGAPGPGPLEPGTVVRWLSEPLRACPTTR